MWFLDYTLKKPQQTQMTEQPKKKQPASRN